MRTKTTPIPKQKIRPAVAAAALASNCRYRTNSPNGWVGLYAWKI